MWSVGNAFFPSTSFQIELCFYAVGHLFTKDLCHHGPEKVEIRHHKTLKINLTDYIIVFIDSLKISLHTPNPINFPVSP